MTNKRQITELDLIETEKDILERRTDQYFQVDFLKAAMIFLVIFDHIVSWGIKSEIGVSFWERICIPVFLVLMGFNMGLSFKRHGAKTLKELYSWRYFKSKILRYIVPFLVLYAFSTIIGLIVYGFNVKDMWYGQYYPNHGFIQLFTGILPFWGPGNWFLPVIFQSILIMPLIYWAFAKRSYLTLVLCFVVEIAMQLIVFLFIGEITSWEEAHILGLFMTSILFYLSAIGLGIWFSFNHDLFKFRNFYIWILFLISLTYLIFYQFFGGRLRIGTIPLIRGDYNFLVFPYSAVLILISFIILPKKSDGKISRAISLIGKSTYHILLTQMLGYGIIYATLRTHYLIDVGFTFLDALKLLYAWIIFIPFGILWYKIDQNRNLIRHLLYYVNFFIVLSIIVYYMFIAFNPLLFNWVPFTMIIILVYAGLGLIFSYILKKPIKTISLALWTSFLVYTFFVTILYISVLPPTEYVIQNISVSTFLIIATIGTVLDYSFSK
ncbi:MAG: acyltransferase [Candidatus Thorarchaeota archaeon]